MSVRQVPGGGDALQTGCDKANGCGKQGWIRKKPA